MMHEYKPAQESWTVKVRWTSKETDAPFTTTAEFKSLGNAIKWLELLTGEKYTLGITSTRITRELSLDLEAYEVEEIVKGNEGILDSIDPYGSVIPY